MNSAAGYRALRAAKRHVRMMDDNAVMSGFCICMAGRTAALRQGPVGTADARPGLLQYR